MQKCGLLLFVKLEYQIHLKMIKITQEFLEESFDVLNLMLFDGKVPSPDILATYEEMDWDTDDFLCNKWGFTKRVMLRGHDITVLMMRSVYDSAELFTEVLAHEMIHVYEMMTLNKMDNLHGDTFWEWESHFNKFGIQLREVI